ncbi:MAG: DUF3429 domain-containing protein [Halieaceae bacterium]|nr:DUF3429 domain-containing protein [Halieaceae bacterium]
MTISTMARLLGYSGLIPFYAFLLGYGLLEDWPRALSKQGFIVYSLAILSFLGGAQWRPALDKAQAGSVARLIVSNGIVIYAVIAVLTAQVFLAAVLLMLGYIALLWYERRIEITSGWYPALRWQLTAGVVVAHLCFAAMQVLGA